MSEDLFPIAYACYNKDINIRLDSTSGGVFTAISKYIIEKEHGIVYGAVFDADFNVIHYSVDDIDSLDKLRGSKYPQSNIGIVYKNIKVSLDNKRTVLFVGTPCQVVGLKNFLKKDYGNLYCIDFVCHGVASPMIWRGYLESLEEKGTIKKIVFKNKYRGWKKWYFMADYGDHVFRRRGGMTEFMRSYLSYANIRPSCYNCHFKGLIHKSDFTISDCWGIGESDTEMNDNKGLSALLLQTPKAKAIFNEIKDELRYKKYDPSLLMEGNWTTYRSVKPNPVRSDFFKYSTEYGAKDALKKYFKPGILSWLHYYYFRLIGKEK